MKIFIGSDHRGVEIKKEIIKLLKLLTKKTYIDYNIEKNVEVNINIFSAINVMEDFFKYGLYQERQKECKLNCKGHINWKRTINIPQLYLNKGILYKNIYKEYINYAFTENIQEIQKYCLLQISKTIGFLFDFSYKPNINKRFKKLQMIEIINSELKKINQDSKIGILNNLLEFIKNTDFEKIAKENIKIKYKEFQYIWQEMIDVVGIKDVEKKEYYPKAGYFYLKDNKINKSIKVNPQIPDTIIKNYKGYEDYLFILDAKYYSIGKFPNEYDIFKQSRYEQYIKRKLSNNKISIINAFLLPNYLSNEIIHIEDFYAKLEGEKEQIYVAYIDTKTLMSSPEKVMNNMIRELVKENEKLKLKGVR